MERHRTATMLMFFVAAAIVFEFIPHAVVGIGLAIGAVVGLIGIPVFVALRRRSVTDSSRPDS